MDAVGEIAMEFDVIFYGSVAMIRFTDGHFIAIPQRKEWTYVVNNIYARTTKTSIIEFKIGG